MRKVAQAAAAGRQASTAASTDDERRVPGTGPRATQRAL